MNSLKLKKTEQPLVRGLPEIIQPEWGAAGQTRQCICRSQAVKFPKPEAATEWCIPPSVPGNGIAAHNLWRPPRKRFGK